MTAVFYMKKPNARGRSLVEIMIALTIGMVILIAVSSLFIGNRQTFRANDDKTRLDEEGRLALNMMALHIRMAGYGAMLKPLESSSGSGNVPEPALYTTYANLGSGIAENAIRGCANGFIDTGASVMGIGCQPGTTSDSFLVRYDVDQNIVALNGALPIDCLGANIILSPPIPAIPGRSGSLGFFRVENRFFVQNNPNTGNPELYCRGNGNTPPDAPFVNAAQPVAENVESMKITYGLHPDALEMETNPDANSQTINQFLTADLMVDPAMWNRVVSVRLCIVVRSANDNLTTARQAYRDCTGNQVVATDRRLRGVFSTTVAIRNRSVGAT